MIPSLHNAQTCQNFFQDCLIRLSQYWQEHPSIKNNDIETLEIEHESILTTINLALSMNLNWLLVKPLVISLAPFMERRGHWQTWQATLNKSVSRAEQSQDLQGLTTLTALQARLAQKSWRPKDVEIHYRQALNLARKTNNNYEQARCSCNLGYHYTEIQKFWRAEKLLNHALKSFNKQKSKHGLAHTHLHYGYLERHRKNYPKAKDHFNQAIQLWKKQGDKNGLKQGYGMLGIAYEETNERQKAIDTFKQSIEYAQASGDKFIGNELRNIAVAYLHLNNYEQAEKYACLAVENYQAFKSKGKVASIHILLQEIVHFQNNPPKAKQHARKALDYFQNTENHIQIATIHSINAFFLKEKQPQEANHALSLTKELINKHKLRHLSPTLEEFLTRLELTKN